MRRALLPGRRENPIWAGKGLIRCDWCRRRLAEVAARDGGSGSGGCGDRPRSGRMAFYRKYTEAMLRRYQTMSMEAGRVPSLLGRELFRGHVTSHTVHSFEDVVIYVHDVEKCLAKLDQGTATPGAADCAAGVHAGGDLRDAWDQPADRDPEVLRGAGSTDGDVPAEKACCSRCRPCANGERKRLTPE